MTKQDDEVLDWRSTGRRKARRALFVSYTPFICVGYSFEVFGEIHKVPCGKTTMEPPKDAPPWFNEIWPEEKRVLTQLQADHETKDLTHNDIEGLEWRCPSCHKFQDQQTEKGEAQINVVKKTQWIDDD